MPALADAGDIRNLAFRLVLIPVAVPMQRVLYLVLPPGFFHNVDFRAILPRLFQRVNTFRRHEPEGGPMPRLCGELTSCFPIAVRAFILTQSADRPARIAVAILFGAQDQIPFAVQECVLLHPECVPARIVPDDFPFTRVYGVTTEFILPVQFPGTALRCGQKRFRQNRETRWIHMIFRRLRTRPVTVGPPRTNKRWAVCVPRSRSAAAIITGTNAMPRLSLLDGLLSDSAGSLQTANGAAYGRLADGFSSASKAGFQVIPHHR